MHGLLTKNIYDQFDCYRMQDGDFIKTGSFSRKQVLVQMSKGTVFYAFCKETTQYAKLIPSYNRNKKAFYMRTDNKHIASDSFFLDMDATRLVPYKKGETQAWATRPTSGASNPDLSSAPEEFDSSPSPSI